MRNCMPAALCLLLGSQSAFAVELDPIIVTATRTAQTADEALSSVTVVTRKEIGRQQAQSVPDLLRGVPGVSVANNGGPGKATSVFLRGTESDHVLVLIDGVKTGSASLGTAALQDIPVEQIERIEIVRGPRSSLYGSEAIGGVIQIFTRKGGGALRPFFSIGGGRYQTYSASAGVSGGSERGWFSVGASGIDTGGFNACNGKPSPDGAGCFTTEPDKDGYRNLAGALRAGYRFDNGLEMDVHALHAVGDNEFDGGFVNESEFTQQVLGGTLRFSPGDIWQATLAVGRSRDESDNFKDGAFQSRFESERYTLSFQNDISIAAAHLLTVGADYQDDRIDGTTAYAVTSRDNSGLFTQYQGSFGAHDVQLSLRRDNNEQFGNRNTGSAAWGYALGEGLRLTVAYGTAFKAPTFNELYFPGFGNPKLRPEASRSVEFGLRGEPAWGRWSLNAYETRVDDLIAYDASLFAPNNIDQARIRGLEAVLGTRLGNWDLNANLTLLDPENRSGGANDGNVLPRRARRFLRLDADRGFARYRLGATLLAAGRRYDDLANTRSLGGYATVDLRAEYALTGNWRVQARLENLLDKDYETAAYFNQPGRSLYLTLRYQP
ncbi:MAG TPA: TonB-dependent vitamin B12 receptor [Gammaproteobacteria bacterium]|nr:TonB-dependent vitamin B12 receptor [Gammaproteobacteria bacterium]